MLIPSCGGPMPPMPRVRARLASPAPFLPASPYGGVAKERAMKVQTPRSATPPRPAWLHRDEVPAVARPPSPSVLASPLPSPGRYLPSAEPPRSAFAFEAKYSAGGPTPAQAKAEPPRRPIVAGALVDFFSESNQCWMPAAVTGVDDEGGFVQVDIKPGVNLDLQEQCRKIRPRTHPNAAQIAWVQAVIRDGRIEDEARLLFERHAVPAASAHQPLRPPNPPMDQQSKPLNMNAGGRIDVPPGVVLRSEVLLGVGAEIDVLLGVCGSVCALRMHAEHYGGVYTLDNFIAVFWELLWLAQCQYGQALRRDRNVDKRRSETPHDHYIMERILGKGTFGTVYLATHRLTGATRAIKELSKVSLQGCEELLDYEVEHLQLLDHPHIVKLHEHFEDASNIYLVMDFCCGGELEAFLNKRRSTMNHLAEHLVAHIMQQLLLAIAHVHGHGIVHLDLKSANIMLMPQRGTLAPARVALADGVGSAQCEQPHVMVIDLGVAQHFRPGAFRNNRPVGTPLTMAPEIWRGVITPKADVFSLGTVLFQMMALQLPWHVLADQKLALEYWGRQPQPPWVLMHQRAASDAAFELCREMLVHLRQLRPSAKQCLRFSFLWGADHRQVAGARGGEHLADDKSMYYLKHLIHGPARSMLHRSISHSIARAWPPNQLPSIRQLFKAIDSSGTGRLEPRALQAVLQRELGLSSEVALEVVVATDLNRDGVIEWTEFVAACILLGNEQLEQDLRLVFASADQDNDGFLDQADVARLLSMDEHASGVHDLFVELSGSSGDNARVDFDGFRRHFRTESQAVKEDCVAAPPPPPQALEVAIAARGSGASQHRSAAPTAAAPAEADGISLLDKAVDWIERARQSFFPDPPADRHLGTSEEDLKAALRCLQEMGFPNQELNLAALRRHRSKVTSSLVEDLCEL